MRKNNSIVVILGNDHTNSLGVLVNVTILEARRYGVEKLDS